MIGVFRKGKQRRKEKGIAKAPHVSGRLSPWRTSDDLVPAETTVGVVVVVIHNLARYAAIAIHLSWARHTARLPAHTHPPLQHNQLSIDRIQKRTRQLPSLQRTVHFATNPLVFVFLLRLPSPRQPWSSSSSSKGPARPRPGGWPRSPPTCARTRPPLTLRFVTTLSLFLPGSPDLPGAPPDQGAIEVSLGSLRRRLPSPSLYPLIAQDFAVNSGCWRTKLRPAPKVKGDHLPRPRRPPLPKDGTLASKEDPFGLEEPNFVSSTTTVFRVACLQPAGFHFAKIGACRLFPRVLVVTSKLLLGILIV